MKKGFLTFLFVAAIMPARIFAYEVHTHEEMSAQAAQRSVLGKGTLLSDIDAGSLGSGYQGMTLLEWIRHGAHHEDDFSSLFFPRFVNHFYNPLTGLGLTGSVFPDVFPSPLWGLEDTEIIRRQAFSLRDALGAFYESLTLPNKPDRDDHLAQTFRTLGHMIHLIQDAAQPQHTRNDSHGSGSVYERLTDAMRRETALPYNGYPSADSVMRLDTARSFWHTLAPEADRQAVMNGLADPNAKGMAEYSNRNFVTLGTNYRFTAGVVQPDPNFPLPAFYLDSVTNVDVAEVQALPQFANCTITRFDAPPLRGELTFYGNPVTDSYQPGTVTNAYASTLSIFDDDLEGLPGVPSRFFTLNRFNYCAAQQFLIPRAVGYSTGLIDYFFRGRVEIEGITHNERLEITIKNVSGDSNILKNGRFKLYYEATDGTRKLLPILSGEVVDNDGIMNGKSALITTRSPGDVDTSKQNPFILVFRGVIGTEEAVFGKVFNVPCSSGIKYASLGGFKTNTIDLDEHFFGAVIPGGKSFDYRHTKETITYTVTRIPFDGSEELYFVGTATVESYCYFGFIFPNAPGFGSTDPLAPRCYGDTSNGVFKLVVSFTNYLGSYFFTDPSTLPPPPPNSIGPVLNGVWDTAQVGDLFYNNANVSETLIQNWNCQ